MRWWRRRSEQDFADEIRSHLELEADRLLQLGLTPEEAQMAARRAFGNVTMAAERFRESRRPAWLDAIARDARFAVRALRHRPAFTATAVCTLAFGIGVNAALFTLLYSLLLRPLPVADAGRVVSVSREVHDDGREYQYMVLGNASLLSYPDYVHLRDGSRTLDQLAAYHPQSLTLTLGDGVKPIRGELASCNYFSAVGHPMSLGRSFAAEECAYAGAGRTVVLSHGFWMRQFGGDPSIVGRTIEINRLPLSVAGVAAPGFSGLDFGAAEVWVPITLYPALYPARAHDLERDIAWLTTIGRLRHDATTDDAQSELARLATELDPLFPGRVSRMHVTRGSRLTDPTDRRTAATIVLAVSLLGALILVMTCANVMNLLLARAVARRREVAIRLSVGASRARLVMQLMVESLLLAFLGAALGLVLAFWLPPIVSALSPDGALNIPLTPDRWVLGATVLIAAGASVLFGLVPALQGTELQLSDAMRGATRGDGRLASSRWRSSAVGVQVAASAVLLVIAALFLQAARHATAVEPGYDLQHVASVAFNLEDVGYDSTTARTFFKTLREEIAATPGIDAVGSAMLVPLRGRGTKTVAAVDATTGKAIPQPTLFNLVSPEYFAATGISLVRGRPFRAEEVERRDPSAVVVSQAFARAAWGSNDPIGRTIVDDARHFTVVGVARDVQSTSFGTMDGPMLYAPADGASSLSQRLMVRSAMAPALVRGAVTRAVRRLDVRVLPTVRGLDEELAQTIAPVRTAGWLATVLGGVAVLLAAVGVYGVVAFTVSARIREIGIRMALGATRRSIRAMIFRQGGRVMGVGLAIGFAAAAGIAHAMRTLLLGVPALNATVFGGTALVLVASGVAAMALPAMRATRIDPMRSLRED